MNIENWFSTPGAYVLVDGQFGSTGKGLFAAYIALMGRHRPNWITTNAGPNSGHTAHIDGKVVTQQLPIATVAYRRFGYKDIRTLLNAGAIINPKRLATEISEYLGAPSSVYIHPCAAIISPEDLSLDRATVEAIASTGKGIGPAVAAKVLRLRGDEMVARHLYLPVLDADRSSWDQFWDWGKDTVFVETAQGFSLGLNSVFYPHVTSRECTVMQAIADARIPAQMVRQVAMCIRTYPIRVGNVGSTDSGPHYEDQEETSWEALGVEPELTTVTKRVRRVFTWSRQQFREAAAANRPDIIFCNFLNYMERKDFPPFLQHLFDDYMTATGKKVPPKMYYGDGPFSSNVKIRWWNCNFKGE